MSFVKIYSILAMLVLVCRATPSPEQAPEPESVWCVEKRGLCLENCKGFGEELKKVSFECSDAVRSMVQASTCVCLGAQDRVLSSSSDSNAKGLGGSASAASSSFASTGNDFVL